MEGKDAEIVFTPEGKQSILTKVVQAEQWEKFLARKYVGTKRFGLDGGESMIPALEAVIKYGGAATASARSSSACRTAAASTSSPTSWPSPIARSSPNSPAAPPIPRTSAARATSNIISAPRPTASSTASGSTVAGPQSQPSRSGRSGRARQGPRPADRARRRRGRQVLPVLLHGDAAFAGQGIVAGMLRLLRHPRLQYRRLPPFHHQQPGRLHHLARSSAAPRLTRRTSPRRSRRRSSTSTATIPRR